MGAMEQYFRDRLREERMGSGTTRHSEVRTETSRSGGPGSEWDWEWSGTERREGVAEPEVDGSVTRTEVAEVSTEGVQNLRKLYSLVEDLEIRMFTDQIRDTSRAYQDVCPRLMDLLERGFMKSWLSSYMSKRRGGEREYRVERERTERGERERSERGERAERGERGERSEREFAEWERAERAERAPRGEREFGEWNREFGEWERAERERGDRDVEWARELSQYFRRTTSDRRDRSSRRGEEEFRTETERRAASENNAMWRGLMASCYIYQDLVHKNAPRLDSTQRRTAQAAAQQ